MSCSNSEDQEFLSALARCGLTPNDLVVKAFDQFQKEFPDLPRNTVAQKFSSHQEFVSRNIDRLRNELLRAEIKQLTPRRLENKAAQYVRAGHRREAREREKERVKNVAENRAEIIHREQKELEEKKQDILRRERERELERQILDAVNADRSRARYERDSQMTELRQQLVAAQSRLPLIPSTPSTPRRSPRTSRGTGSVVDKRITEASATRKRLDGEKETLFNSRREEDRRRDDMLSAIREMEEEERQATASARERHAAEVMERARTNYETSIRQHEEHLRIAAGRQTETLLRSQTERASATAEFALARDKCVQNASEYRTAKAYELWQRHIEKSAMEEERKATLKRESREARMIRAEERQRRFQLKEASVTRMRRSAATRSAELAQTVAERQDAATSRRQFLLDSVYEQSV